MLFIDIIFFIRNFTKYRTILELEEFECIKIIHYDYT